MNADRLPGSEKLRCPAALALALLGLAGSFASVSGQSVFTLEELLRIPYAQHLTASTAPGPGRFAWVEVEQGRHNLWVGGPGEPAHALTRYTDDDGQDLRELVWLAGGQAVAFTRGPEAGADGKPANAAHTQPPPTVQVWAARVVGDAPQLVGEGHTPVSLPKGNSLLFVRAGQVWQADLDELFGGPTGSRAAASRRRSTQTAPGGTEGARNDGAAAAGILRSGSGGRDLPIRQRVWDRGSASQLAVSPDGRQLAFISRRDHNHSFLALFDFRTGTLSFPAASTGNDAAPAWSPDGHRLAWLRSPWTEAAEFAVNKSSANPWSIAVLDVATGAVRSAFAPEAGKLGSVLPHMSSGAPKVMWTGSWPGHAAGNAARQAGSAGLIFASEADGWVHLYAVPVDAPAGTKPTLLTPLPGEIEDPVLSPDGRVLLYSSRGPESSCLVAERALLDREPTADGQPPADRQPPPEATCPRNLPLPENADRRTIFRLDLAQPAGSPFPLPLTALSVIATQVVVAGDGSAAALVADERTPAHPALLSPVAAPVGAMDRAAPTRPLHPELYANNSVRRALLSPQPVTFPSSDGLFTLHGQLFLPAAITGDKAGRHPAVLFFHGGPRRQMLLGYPAMEYYVHAYAMNQYLASRGFIVLSVNYRGGIGYGMDFREAAHTGADGASEYSDVLGAIAYLRSRPDVDARRIGSWGGSYGGYLTALALARNSDLVAAGVDFHGVHEWELEDNRGDWLRGSADEQKTIAVKAHASSPMADIDRWRSPVLLIHGDNDANVAYAQTPTLADALRGRGVPVEELIFPDEIHEFLLYRDWLASYQATAAFLERRLSPGK